MPRHTIIGHESNTISALVDDMVIFQQSSMDNQTISRAIITVSVSWKKILLEETKLEKTVDSDWGNNMEIPKESKEYWEAFFEMLAAFQAM